MGAWEKGDRDLGTQNMLKNFFLRKNNYKRNTICQHKSIVLKKKDQYKNESVYLTVKSIDTLRKRL